MTDSSPAGWYPDPHGGTGLRYWDGATWTERQSSAPPQKAPAPPAPASSPAPQPQAPSPSPAPSSGDVPMWVKVAGGVVLGFVALIVGCGVLIGVGVDEVQKESDRAAITQAELDAVAIGSTREQVEAALGPPESEQNMESQEVLGTGTTTFDCIYYPKEGELISSYQLCFDNGVLTSKNAY